MQCARSDQLPGLSDEYGKNFVADLTYLDADPAFDSDVGRFEVDFGSFSDHGGLMACRHGNPDGDAAVVVVIVRKHDEDFFADKEGRFAVGYLLRGFWQGESHAADALNMVFWREDRGRHASSTLRHFTGSVNLHGYEGNYLWQLKT